MKKYEFAKERLNNIRWSELKGRGNKSNVLLLIEYYRRVSNFYNNEKMKYTPNPVFFHIGMIFEGKYGIKRPTVDIYEICPSIKKIAKESLHLLCANYIELAILADEGIELAIEYKDIYEPIIRLCEKGGVYRRSHDNGYETDGGSVVFHIAHSIKIKELDISDEALKYYEETGVVKYLD